MGNVKKCIRENHTIPIPIIAYTKRSFVHCVLTPSYISKTYLHKVISWWERTLLTFTQSEFGITF